MESKAQPTTTSAGQSQAASAQQSSFGAVDAIDLVPLGNSPAPSERKTSTSPSRVSNTLEHQMTVNTDPRQPRGEPQLVGLTRARYDPSKVAIEPLTSNPTQNYIIESAKTFFPEKQNSKRINQMKTHARHLAGSQHLIKLTIELPTKMLVEQLNLIVNSNSKKQSDFSKAYSLVSVLGTHNELVLKSAYSECVTRSGKLEYNLVGVTKKMVLVFAKDNNAAPVSTDHIQIKIQQAADIDLEDRVLAGGAKHGITADDDEDCRILDSLPHSTSPDLPQCDPALARLLQSIEVVGFNMISVPAITNLTYFMNQQFYLQSRQRESEAHQVEFMTGQLLVTTKRATQAVEMYRKMQIKCLSQMAQSTYDKQKKLVQCAVYELLIADSLSPNLQMNDKILSINRLACFLRGEEPSDVKKRFPAQIAVARVDSFSSILVNLPDCLRFTIACLSHRVEIVRISALKMLKYILETLGCSLDYGMVFILKAMLRTYPGEGHKWTCGDEDFDFERLLGVEISIVEYLFKTKTKKSVPTSSVVPPTQTMSVDEPSSGSKRAMINIYNHVLDTFISVLSSVSSHILHSIFYDVIEPTLLVDSGFPIEVRVFTCKIADKIFTICQGDLLLTPRLLDTLLTLTSNQKAQLPDSIEQTAQTQIKNLWQSIRQKVLPNYSTKGFQSLVNWLVQNLTDLKSQQEGVDDRVRQMAEVITIVAVGRQKNEEDANQLIRLPSYERYGGGPSSELYLVLAPLLYWLEYSIDREERFSLFLQLYQTVKDVLTGLPKGQSDLDVASIMFPALQRASDFMAGNSPNLSMLKFLDLVLNDMLRHYQRNSRSSPPLDIQHFFLEMLQNFVTYISYSLYEEVLFVFEKLIALCSDVISEKVLSACIIGLIDKYTMKSKQLKNTVATFMKFLLNTNQSNKAAKAQSSPTSQRTEGIEEMLSEGGGLDHSLTRSNYFEMMADFCFFSNQYGGGGSRNVSRSGVVVKQLEFRSAQDLHELNIEKLQFFIESLSLMNESHITVFTNLITHPNFRHSLMSLIDNGESQVRLKAHEIMESLTQYFVQYCPSKTVYEFTNGTNQNEMMDAEFISHERLYISQIVIQVAKVSLEKSNDCYLQFNSLILLDFLFQNLLPVPTFQNEQLKSKRNGAGSQQKNSDDGDVIDEITMDVEILSISESTPELDVMDPAYLRMRMKLVFSLWPHIQSALNSPWSNIRSICYGLICSMLKVDVNDYPKEEPERLIAQHLSYEESDHIQASQAGLTQIVLPMLYSLLGSKESESKAGGLNILGSFCGLSYDFTSVKIHKHLGFFQRNSKFVSHQIWKLVFGLQDDWDITIKEASVVLIQLCAPRNAINYFQSLKENREKSKLEYMLKMDKASDAYARNASVKDLQNTECPIKSEHAKRAIALFPNKVDCKAVLDSTTIDGQELTNGDMSFEQFMFSRKTSFPCEIPAASQIQAMSDTLATLIHQFNPNYEDKRLTKPQQPMSRRRQIEIELNLNGRGKEAAQAAADADPNFFVDGYSDDQIQEIISIFRNDFKPPKNLWIEKQPNQYQQNYGHHGQPAVSNSPDFFQDIYADAIEQFNQHQMMMQQRQQDELQQQVSSGTSISQSSVSSTESVGPNDPSDPAKPTTEPVNLEKADSQNSSTPSPPNMNKSSTPDENILPPAPVKKANPVIASSILPTTGMPGGQWPTSPVLVSSSTDKSKHQASSSFNIPDPSQDKSKKDKKQSPKASESQEEEDYPSNIETLPPINNKDETHQQLKKQKASGGIQTFAQHLEVDQMLGPNNNQEGYEEDGNYSDHQSQNDDGGYEELVRNSAGDIQQFNKTHHKLPNFTDDKNAHQTNSAPDFNLINLKNQSPRGNKRSSQQRESLDYSGGGGRQGDSGDQRISRKTAQTYLSNLNQGYIQGIDNMKLINNCLSQQQMAATATNTDSQKPNSFLNLQLNMINQPSKKLSIKTQPLSESQQISSGQNYGSQKSQRLKKQNHSSSPDASGHHPRKSSKLGKKKEKQSHSGTSTKQMNNLADLNFFIKTIEKDLCKNMKVDASSFPTTPSTIVKRVEDQMRALGVDPKLFHPQQNSTSQPHHTKDKPQMKLLALNQIVKHSEENMTPSSQSLLQTAQRNKVSPGRLVGGRSHDSDIEYCKTQRLSKKQPLLQANFQQEKIRTHRGESDSRERDQDRQSSGRGGASNNSAGHSYNYQQMTQPAILTDRSSSNTQNLLGLKTQQIGKQSSSARYDSAQPFQFKKGSSKSQTKAGYSALASKSILSPTLKRDQQSGGLVQGKMGTISMNQMHASKTASGTSFLKKAKVSFNKGQTLNEVSTGSGEIGAKTATSSTRQPHTTRNAEQGDKKQFSPESVSIGKPPLKRKKSGHSHTNSTVPKPSLELQQPSYI